MLVGQPTPKVDALMDTKPKQICALGDQARQSLSRGHIPARIILMLTLVCSGTVTIASSAQLAIAHHRQGGQVEQLSAKGASSRASLWAALDGKVICGLAIHLPEAPAELLCAARSVPPPKHTNVSEGDPGFVFLGSAGHPRPARLSQYSWEREGGWESKHRVELKTGQEWGSGSIEVACTIRAHGVRCVNDARHGFTIKMGSYRAF
jgi:hypothetical protein